MALCGVLPVLGCGADAAPLVAPAGDHASSPSSAVAAAPALAFRQVTAGTNHSCGVTNDDLAYCWGENYSGQLGVGTTTDYLTPVPVQGNLRFRNVVAGDGDHTCGLTTADRAYCWGAGDAGQLGNGTIGNRTSPVAVAGGISFRQLSAGASHTCGVTRENTVYCWGFNVGGKLGDGTTTHRPSPVLVRGGRAFRQVSSGQGHTCGITTADKVFCWGANDLGQVGDSTEVPFRTTPVRLAGGRSYRQVDAGRNHTCAVTLDGRAFCWGDGRWGQLGNGRTYLSFWPRRVAGSLSYERVSAGSLFSCGVTTTNLAYCWGVNSYGVLGDGSTTDRLRPTAVVGGHAFPQLFAGGGHTCARTPAGAAYCWGGNYTGQLGDGTTDDSAVPVEVAGPN